MRKIAAFISLVLILAASGCIFDTGSPVSVEESQKTDIVDVISIESVRTIPSSPVYTDQSFKLYVTVRNNDNEKTINNVNVEIIDASVFGITNGVKTRPIGDIMPLGEKTVNFDLKSPSYDRISGVDTDGLISLRVTYYFESVAAYDLVVVNERELEEQTQSGSNIHLISNKVIGSGPVKMYSSLLGAERGYVISGNDCSFSITIKNEGTGILSNNRIDTGKVVLEFPSEFSPSSPTTTEYITGNAIATGMATANYCEQYCCDEAGGCFHSGYEIRGQVTSRTDYPDPCIGFPYCYVTSCGYGCWISPKTAGYSSTDDIAEGEVCYCYKSSDCDCRSGGTQRCTSSGCASGGTGTTSKTGTTKKTTTTSTVPMHVTPYPSPSEQTYSYFTCSGGRCVNNAKAIDIVGKESIPLLFRITAPYVDIYKTYVVHSTVGYTYELRRNYVVTVKAPYV